MRQKKTLMDSVTNDAGNAAAETTRLVGLDAAGAEAEMRILVPRVGDGLDHAKTTVIAGVGHDIAKKYTIEVEMKGEMRVFLQK
jgi:hypothetical protein